MSAATHARTAWPPRSPGWSRNAAGTRKTSRASPSSTARPSGKSCSTRAVNHITPPFRPAPRRWGCRSANCAPCRSTACCRGCTARRRPTATIRSAAFTSGPRQAELLSWLERHVDRARQLTPAEIDELLELQENGSLTTIGVERCVELIERRRRLVDQVRAITRTEYLGFLEQLVGLLHDRVQPPTGSK